MDTESSEVGRLGRDEIDKLLERLPEDRKMIEKDMADVLKQMIDDFTETKIVLPAPASKELCLHSAKGLRMAFGEISESYKVKSEPSKTHMEHIIEVYEGIWKRLEVLAEEEKDDHQKTLIKLTGALQEGEFCEAKGALELFFGQEKRLADVLLQESLQELVKGQNEELQKWFANKELGEVISHLKMAESTRPDVTVDINSSRSAMKLPTEIMGIIYGSCNLETCVALREVNKAWYAAFQNSEPAMEHKMKERNPWIKPGDPDLQTWADCVLVFAGRLRSGKWKTTACLEEDLHVPYEPWVAKTVVGEVVDPDEKLPANFSGIFDKPDQVRVPSSTGVEFLMDPWTLSSRGDYILYEVVREDNEGTVIRFDDLEITLDPASARSEFFDIHLQERTIYIRLDDYTMAAFPRDKPHYKNGLKLDCLDDDVPGPLMEVGDVVVHRQDVNYEYRFSLVDFDRQETTFICENANPAAFYNGLMWVSVGGFLAPLFVDLEAPGVAYYRADRAIRGIGKMSYFTQASKSKGLGQFTVREDKHSLLLVDLATGILTTLLAPKGLRHSKIIPGFQDGVFQVRCVKKSGLRRIKNRVLRENGVMEEEEDGDDDDDYESDDDGNNGWF